MRRELLSGVILILALLLSSGCSYNVIVPDVDMPIQPPENQVKISLKTAVLLPDENLEMTKKFSVGDFSYTFTVPFGKMIAKSSLGILPHHFEKITIVRNRNEVDGFDLILVPTVDDFFWESAITGLSTNHIKARVHLKTVASDPKGDVIGEKATFSPWITKTYSGMSGDEWGKHYGMALSEATAVALKDAVRGMIISRSFQDYVAAGGKSGTVPAVFADEPALVEKAKPADLEMAKKRLKAAFENGAITIEQLNKAFDELSSPQRSKMLDAFLQGKLEEKEFAELY